MSDLAYIKLSDSEARERLARLQGWKIEGGKLSKSFGFESYKDGLVFAVAAGHLADRLNHHPDMLVGYARVDISVSTHDVGGLSPFDFELARRIDALL